MTGSHSFRILFRSSSQAEYSVGRSTIHRIIHRPEQDSTAQQA
jgi:hypothetical protein